MYRKMAHKFSNEVLYAFTGVRESSRRRSPSRPSREREGKEIFVVGSTARTCARSPTTGASTCSPLVPEGDAIAYTSYRTGVPVVYLKSLSAGTERSLLAFGAPSPGRLLSGREIPLRVRERRRELRHLPVRLADSSVEKVVEGTGSRCPRPCRPTGGCSPSSPTGAAPPGLREGVRRPGERRISFAGGYSTSPTWSPRGPDRLHLAVGRELRLYAVSLTGRTRRSSRLRAPATASTPVFPRTGGTWFTPIRKRDILS